MTLTNKKFIIFAFLVIGFLFIRIIGVGTDISNSDAARWHRRSIRFLEALKQKDYSQTYQHYQPGVTLMWLDSINFQINKSWPDLENSDIYPQIHANAKVLIATVLGILLVIQMCLILRLYGDKTAYIYGFLMSVEPYLIGIDRWVHLTSLETYFGFTGVLTAVYYQRSRKNVLLILSALFLGLAVLSKLTSLIFVAFVIIYFILNTFNLRSLFVSMFTNIFTNTFINRGVIGPLTKDIFLLLFFTLLFFTLLFPAMLSEPQNVLTKLWIAITNAVNTDIRGEYFYGIKSLLYYPTIFLFKLSPITLILFILGLFQFRKNGWPVLLFAFLLIFMTLSDKKIDRYSIIFFPSILLIVSQTLSRYKTRVIYSVCVAGLVFLGFVTQRYFPVYSAYYSPLAGGEKQALFSGFYENSGEYYAQAALYLNQKDRNLKVYVPDNYEAFSYFHKGSRVRNYSGEVSYVVTGVDFDRQVPRGEICNELEKSFGPKTVNLYKITGVDMGNGVFSEGRATYPKQSEGSSEEGEIFPTVYVYKCSPEEL